MKRGNTTGNLCPAKESDAAKEWNAARNLCPAKESDAAKEWNGVEGLCPAKESDAAKEWNGVEGLCPARESDAAKKSNAVEGLNEEKHRRSIKDFAIRNRRDWVIFWVFAALAAYVAGNRYNWPINDWLRGIGNPWLTNLNEPTNYGRTMVALVLLAVLVEIVLFLCRKTVRMKLAALAVGLILPFAVVGAYQLHCKLIVSVLWDETPSSIGVKKDGVWTVWKSGEENRVPAEQWQKLLEFCRNLTIVADEREQEECMEWYRSEEDAFVRVDYVSLTFPRKYGHEYVFSLRLKDGYVYLWRGYKYKEQTPLVTFFEDNSITEWLYGTEEP